MQYAVPGKLNKKGTFIPQQCSYYLRNSSVATPEDGVCYADMFTKEVDRCKMWVFEEGERTIMNDVSDGAIKTSNVIKDLIDCSGLTNSHAHQINGKSHLLELHISPGLSSVPVYSEC